jgi:hypothetical protein
MPAFETSSLTLGDAIVTRSGSRNSALSGSTTWSPGDLKVQWQPKVFPGSDSTRVSISFQSTEAAATDLANLESWVLHTVASDPRRFIGQSWSSPQVKDRFVSCLKESDRGFSTIRCKMNTEGKNQVRCWDESKALREMPEDWTSVSVRPQIIAKGVWSQSSQWGLVLELVDAQISEAKPECPF